MEMKSVRSLRISRSLTVQTRIVLENCGKIDAESIDEYIAAGGFSALAKAVTEMTPQDVIDEVTRSVFADAEAPASRR